MPKRGRPRGSKSKKSVGSKGVPRRVSRQLSDVITPEEPEESVDDIVSRIAADAGEPRDVVETEIGAPTVSNIDPVTGKRRRGRPRKIRYTETGEPIKQSPIDKALDRTHDLYHKQAAKELSERAQIIFGLSTGLAGKIRPYYEMTEDEAADICDPGASYLMRKGELGQRAKEFVEQWDLIAFVLASANYAVRVYLDEKAYRSNAGEVQAEQATRKNDANRITIQERIARAVRPNNPVNQEPETRGTSKRQRQRPLETENSEESGEAGRPSKIIASSPARPSG